MKEKLLTFDKLMDVIKGKVKVKGQSGLETVGAAQMYYFGTRFGEKLNVEALATKCKEAQNDLEQYVENFKTVINGIQEELNKTISEKLEKKASQFANYDVSNLDAMISRLQAMKEAKESNAS